MGGSCNTKKSTNHKDFAKFQICKLLMKSKKQCAIANICQYDQLINNQRRKRNVFVKKKSENTHFLNDVKKWHEK